MFKQIIKYRKNLSLATQIGYCLVALAALGCLLYITVAMVIPTNNPKPSTISKDGHDALQLRSLAELKSFTDWLDKNKVKGFVGEIGWPGLPNKDYAQWNKLANLWYQQAQTSGLMSAAWSTGEWWPYNYTLATYRADGQKYLNSQNTQAQVIEAYSQTANVINLSGAEFGTENNFSNVNPGVSGKDYNYPSMETYQYLSSRGMKVVRLPFRWERLQRSLYGPLDDSEVERLKTAVERAQAAGLKVILDMHNYGEYRSSSNGIVTRLTIGLTSLPFSAYNDVWLKISAVFNNNPGIYAYDIMNEPHDMAAGKHASPAVNWELASQTVVDALRSSGDNTLLAIAGYNWSGVQSWSKTHKTAWINDKANNIVYEAHHYWDKDHEGIYSKSYNDELKSLNKE